MKEVFLSLTKTLVIYICVTVTLKCVFYSFGWAEESQILIKTFLNVPLLTYSLEFSAQLLSDMSKSQVG